MIKISILTAYKQTHREIYILYEVVQQKTIRVISDAVSPECNIHRHHNHFPIVVIQFTPPPHQAKTLRPSYLTCKNSMLNPRCSDFYGRIKT